MQKLMQDDQAPSPARTAAAAPARGALRALVPVLGTFLGTAALLAACSAGDSTGADGGGGESSATDQPPESLPPADTPSPAVENLGGAPSGYEVSHPLFGAGNYTGVDLDDPCNVAAFWKADSAMELRTGTQVIYEGQLWEITGATVDTDWAMEICTPPGQEWCAAEYGWKVVQECPAAAGG
jgi:hypothetical protein